MTRNKQQHESPFYRAPLFLLSGGAVVVAMLLVVFRPDRPKAAIVPASSTGPAFAVQVLRARSGLPLAGLLPPQWFGVDAKLEFDSSSEGATVQSVAPGRIEFQADGWILVLVFDEEGGIDPESRLEFKLMFENRRRNVRCRPADPATGSLKTVVLEETNELAGSFQIELLHCEDAQTGKPLGWPPQPLVLHGSFDRLPLGAD